MYTHVFQEKTPVLLSKKKVKGVVTSMMRTKKSLFTTIISTNKELTFHLKCFHFYTRMCTQALAADMQGHLMAASHIDHGAQLEIKTVSFFWRRKTREPNENHSNEQLCSNMSLDRNISRATAVRGEPFQHGTTMPYITHIGPQPKMNAIT